MLQYLLKLSSSTLDKAAILPTGTRYCPTLNHKMSLGMQPGPAQKARTFQKLPSDSLQEVLQRISTRELIFNNESQESFISEFVEKEFSKGLFWRWTNIGKQLQLAASGVFSCELMTVVSRIIMRAFYEWGTPLRVPVVQSLRHLNFEGRLPFPEPRFVIKPGGAIDKLPWGPGVLGGGEMQEGHAYVVGIPAGSSLRDGRGIAIELCMLRQQRPACVKITVLKEEFSELKTKVPRPGVLYFDNLGFEPLQVGLCNVFCGVICYLFLSDRTAMYPIPRRLLEAYVWADAPQGRPLAQLPLEDREGLVFLMYVLPLVVPSFTVRYNDRGDILTLDMLPDNDAV
jgi:hypothetical protein